MQFGIIVHGGAWSIPDEVKGDHLQGVEQAMNLGYDRIIEGKNAVDVVEEVVSLLENNPTFDAGKGSHLNDLAQVEMDAIIADQHYNIGAVCAIQNVRNPIKVARQVMDETEHVMIVGSGASRFAYQQGFAKIPTEELLVGRERETYEKLRNAAEFSTKDPFNPEKQGFGTVGCVVKDKAGNLAIGVSTGGTPHKLAGRVGDTPLWGAGGYVNTHAGVAATGFGEDLIRTLISQRVIAYIENGMTPQQACNKAIEFLEEEVQGLGGVICLSPEQFGLAFNTKRMAFAVQVDGGGPVVGIEPGDLQTMLNDM